MRFLRHDLLLPGLTLWAALTGCSSPTVAKRLVESTTVLGDTELRRITRDGDRLPERIEVLRGDDIAWVLDGLSLMIVEAYEGKDGRAVPIAAGDDVTGDGRDDIVITQSVEGAHPGEIVWMLSVDEWFGIYVAYRVEVPAPAKFIDIDGDGVIEILTYDDAFAYFGGLSLGDSPQPAVVLKLDGGEYVWWPDGTQVWLRKSATEEPENRGSFQSDQFHEVDGVDAASLSRVVQLLYAGDDSEAWTLLEQVAVESSVADKLRKCIERRMLGSWVGRGVLARNAASHP